MMNGDNMKHYIASLINLQAFTTMLNISNNTDRACKMREVMNQKYISAL